MRKSQSEAVEITLKKLVSLASIRLRGIVIAPNRKRHSYCDVTTIRQTRRFRFLRRQISRWRRRWSKQTGGGGRFLLSSVFLLLVLFFNVCCHPVHVLLGCSGLCDIRILFMYDVCQFAWRIAPIRSNNVSLCPSIFFTKYIRPAAAFAFIKHGPSACRLDALTTTLPAPLLTKFQV